MGKEYHELCYLDEDASYLQCSICGRKAWDGMVNMGCKMPQPDGTKCKGIMEGRVVR